MSGQPRVSLAPGPLHAGPVRAYLPIVSTGLLLAVVPLVVGDSRYHLRLGVLMLVLATHAVGFNLIFGATGQLFLCLGALAGVSAYTAVLLGNLWGLPMYATVPIGAAVAGSVGGLLSWVAVRRRLGVIFVGILTLAFSLTFTNLLLGGRRLTGGETGLLVDQGAGGVLRDRVGAYLVFVLVLVACLVGHRWLERARAGWAFRALRDDPLGAELAGVDVARYRVLAGMVGSAMIGLVGALFAAHDGFVSPTTFGFAEVDVRVIVALAFGGVGTLFGPLVGALTLTAVDELLRPLGQLRLTVHGLVLIAVVLGFRTGIVPSVSAWAARRRGRRPAG